MLSGWRLHDDRRPRRQLLLPHTSSRASRRTPRCSRCSSRLPSDPSCRGGVGAAPQLSARDDGVLTPYASGKTPSTKAAAISSGATVGARPVSWRDLMVVYLAIIVKWLEIWVSRETSAFRVLAATTYGDLAADVLEHTRRSITTAWLLALCGSIESRPPSRSGGSAGPRMKRRCRADGHRRRQLHSRMASRHILELDDITGLDGSCSGPIIPAAWPWPNASTPTVASFIAAAVRKLRFGRRGGQPEPLFLFHPTERWQVWRAAARDRC